MDEYLKCPKCGQTERFHANAVEYHTWVVDKYGEFQEDMGCEDADKPNPEYRCGKCNASAEWVEDEDEE